MQTTSPLAAPLVSTDWRLRDVTNVRVYDGGLLMAATYELIASTTLGSAAGTVSLSSIPATYDDICVIASVRDTWTGGQYNAILVRPNGATTNLSCRALYGTGSSAASLTNASNIYAWSNSSGATADTFASIEFYFPNYAGAANKSVSISGVTENNSATSNLLYATAGLWASTTAISSVDFVSDSSRTFATGSSFYLYGVTHA